MKPAGVSVEPINLEVVRISYHYIGTHEEACELFGVHEAIHDQIPMPYNCIKCEEKNASVTHNTTT